MKGVSVMRSLFNKKQAQNLTGVSSERVKLLVSEKLGDTEQVYAKPKYKKASVAIILAATLCITTAIAANSSWLIHYIFNDKVPDKILAEIENITQSMSYKNYTITVEQALFGKSTAYLIVSVEAKTSEDFQKMGDNSDDFIEFIYDLGITYMYEGEKSEWSIDYGLPELDNGRKKYIAVEYMDENPKNSDFLVYANPNDEPDLYIRIPVKNMIKTVDFKIDQKVSNAVLDCIGSYNMKNSLDDVKTDLIVTDFSISSLDFTMNYKTNGKFGQPIGLIAFMMNDGSIYGQGELLQCNMCKFLDDNENYCYFKFNNLELSSNIKAVIIDKTVYPLDKSEPYKLKEDILFKPFIADYIPFPDKNYGSGLSINDVCEKIGANFSFDEKAQTVSITYKGKTSILNIGTTNIKFPLTGTETQVITDIVGEDIVCDRLSQIIGFNTVYINFDEQSKNGDLYIAP